jgi:tetratricopeptide (TPR) repeat protein
VSRARRARAAAALATALLLGGCLDARPQLVARHEAERASWHAERDEADVTKDEAREAHLGIARRFGPDAPPGRVPPGARPGAAADYRARQVIAGSSALRAADLAAETRGASLELAEEYADVADRWPDVPDLHFLGRLREGATLQRVGDRHGALAAFRDVQQQAGTIDDDAYPWARALTVDLEVHVALLSRDIESAGDVARGMEEARRRLAKRASDWAALPEGRRARRRGAEMAFLAGDTNAAVAAFDSLAASASGTHERAELELALGEIQQFARKDLDAAETAYRAAMQQGPLEPAAAEARIRLVALCLDRGIPEIGVRIADEVLTLGARALAGHESEARYWRGRCLLELGRWTDAIPSFEDGARGDPASPFTLACAARLHRRMREFEAPDTEAASARLLDVARRVPPPPPIPVPCDWAKTWREERAAFAWKEGVDELKRLDDPDQAEAARAAAGRILRERTILAQKTPDDPSFGRR